MPPGGKDKPPGPQRALIEMLNHAARHSPYYREQDWAARLRAGQAIRISDIPITGKSAVRGDAARFYCDVIPPGDGPVQTKHTSGSTGEPLHIRKTRRAFSINDLENARLREGWDLEAHLSVAFVKNPQDDRPTGTEKEQTLENGGRMWTLHTVDTRQAFEHLRRTAATAVVIFPSVLLGALECAAEASVPLPLRLALTFSEVVPDELRELVRAIPGCRLADQYGCVEAGLIAVQCPLCDAYHPAGRHLLLELITDEGRPAGPGEMGRVIVTPFFNRAMPLVRYETGDYALVAEQGGCPRAPVSLARILGRRQNLFRLPDGRRIMPRLPSRIADRLALRRFKLFQRTPSELEFHYVPLDPRGEVAATAVQAYVDMYMAPGFTVRCVKVSEIPRAASGKYLMHESFV
jgi:phenylacetate-CoA ligase